MFHPDQAAAGAEEMRSVGTRLVDNHLEDIRPDTRLYSSDTKRPKRAPPAEVWELPEALGRRKTAARKVSLFARRRISQRHESTSAAHSQSPSSKAPVLHSHLIEIWIGRIGVGA
jgi:hypothetical protein